MLLQKVDLLGHDVPKNGYDAMSEQEELIQKIIDEPAEDPPRLAYAARLERQGPSAHAELIRVQCELAQVDAGQPSVRTEDLRQREAQMLESAEFAAMGWYRELGYQFVRGFIPQWDAGSEREDQHAEEVEPDDPYDWKPHRDKILTVNFVFGQCYAPGPEYLHKVACSEWWRRVTRLEFWSSKPSAEAIEILGTFPHLLNLRKLVMRDCTLPMESMHKLVLAPSIRGLTELSLAWQLAGGDGKVSPATADDPRVNAFIARIADSPKVAQLEDLDLNFFDAGIGKEGALALLESPYLKNLRRLFVSVPQAIPPELRIRLEERFGTVDIFHLRE